MNTPTESGKRHDFSEPSSPSAEIESDNDVHIDLPEKQSNGSGHKAFPGIKSFGKSALHTNRASSIMDDAESQQDCASGGITVRPSMQSHSKVIFQSFFLNLFCVELDDNRKYANADQCIIVAYLEILPMQKIPLFIIANFHYVHIFYKILLIFDIQVK